MVSSSLPVDAKVVSRGAIADVEEEAPEEVRGEPTGQDDDEDRQVLPERVSTMLDRQVGDRLAGREAVRHARAQDAGNRGHEHTLDEAELVDDRVLLLVGQLALLGPAGQAADHDPGQADADAEQDRRAGGRPRDAFRARREREEA